MASKFGVSGKCWLVAHHAASVYTSPSHYIIVALAARLEYIEVDRERESLTKGWCRA